MDNLKLITNKVNAIFYPHEIWAVGGSVRDSIIGNEPKDFDYCTALLPDSIEEMIRNAGRKPYLIGKRFGTIGFKVELEHAKYVYVEVTTLRNEVYEPNNRKPSVYFVSDLKEDLSRRDFTLNAIAYRNGELFDPLGGRLDILAKKIRSVGEAVDRFKDDPLRLLRAARFAAQLGYEVDPNLIGKMRKMNEKILTISRERWMQELDKLLIQPDAMKGIDILHSTGILKFILPEVSLIYRNDEFPRFNFDGIPPKIFERWIVLLKDIGRPYIPYKENKRGESVWPNQHMVATELTKGIAARLKWSNERTDYVVESVSKAGDL